MHSPLLSLAELPILLLYDKVDNASFHVPIHLMLICDSHGMRLSNFRNKVRKQILGVSDLDLLTFLLTTGGEK